MPPAMLSAQSVLHPGKAEGVLLKLAEPLSFWGGFDPRDGRILDRSHPEVGRCIAGTILALPGSRGSAGTPAGVAEALRGGVGPAAILLPKPDVNIMVGAQVAARLYALEVPVLVLTEQDYNRLATGQKVSLAETKVRLLEV